MEIKIYNCFHDHGSTPNAKYISETRPSLLCGVDVSWRHTADIVCDFRDNVGETISSQNEQYSELTGYYWIWKNQTADIVGIEHYRRHFIKHHHLKENERVKKEDLFTPEEIVATLEKYDFILPVEGYMNDYTIYELYISLFGKEFADSMVTYMKKYFIENNMQQYIDPMYYILSHNILVRGNLLITTKKNFDSYCEVMFGMIDYLKEHVEVLKIGRTWGYITEIFSLIYVRANNKTYTEVDVAIEDYNPAEDKVTTQTSLDFVKEPFTRDPNEIIEKLEQL